MKFFDQARLAQSGLPDDEHELAVALPRPFPAPRQDRYLFFTADQWREMPLSRAASCTARPHYPEQGYRVRHALEFVAAAVLGNERAATWRCTFAVTRTAPGSASACTRAARLATSP